MLKQSKTGFDQSSRRSLARRFGLVAWPFAVLMVPTAHAQSKTTVILGTAMPGGGFPANLRTKMRAGE